MHLGKELVIRIVENLSERMQEDMPIFEACKLFSPKHYLSKELEHEACCKQWLQQALHQYGSLVDDVQICMGELDAFVTVLSKNFKRKSFLDAWDVCRDDITMRDSFPNLMRLWEILSVVPVKTAAAERGFSLQNNIKSAHITSMSTTLLENYMFIGLNGPDSTSDVPWDDVFAVWRQKKKKSYGLLFNDDSYMVVADVLVLTLLVRYADSYMLEPDVLIDLILICWHLAEVVQTAGGVEAVSCLLGLPLGHNSSYHRGTAFAPPFVREAIWSTSANSTTEEGGKDLKDPRVMVDIGDMPIQELQSLGIEEKDLMDSISNAVKLVMNEPYLRPLIIGGDHSISYPIVRAVSEKLGGPVDVLHIDAHPDLYDAFENNIYSHASSFARIMEGGYARRLLQLIHSQVGIRSINYEGPEQAKKFGVELFEMRHYEEHRKFLENLQSLGEGVKGVYISIDVDCLDPGFASGVSHIESGGLSFRDVMRILQNLKANIVGGDVVEYNPQRDTAHHMTAMVASKFVRELVAKMSK
ncbi:hypothetical protein L7F22_060851 [Adiantum nelumboides]|nr:hypothetical protein [Adiantum nelumboides]